MKLDKEQKIIKEKLASLALKLEKQEGLNFWQRFFAKKSQFKSIYIYGDVGTGKTMLMKNFYNLLPKTAKRYFYFNQFMLLIHQSLRDVRNDNINYKDELIEAVKRVILDVKLICFDEFQVVDIADAMLLARIFTYLFDQKVTVIFTSNTKPQNLYKDGLQREVFLQFVNQVLIPNCEIVNLDNKIDYRGRYCRNLEQRYFINNTQNCLKVSSIIKELTNDKKLEPSMLKVWGRELIINRSLNDIAIFNFDELCQESLSAYDYQAICQKFNLIFLLQVPQIAVENSNEARRLTLFIDEVYENKVGLIVLAKVEASKIYQYKSNAKAFKRTVSRFNEIKSDAYWQASKANF